MAAPQAPAFQVGIELPSQIPVTPAVTNALKDLGIGYANFYVTNAPEWEPSEMETLTAMARLCDTLGLEFSLACHHRNPSEASVHTAAGFPRFRGVLIDELEHIRLLFPQFAPIAREDMLADPTRFTDLQTAHRETFNGYRQLYDRFRTQGAPQVTATHVWPELLHTAARAGMIPCPKICKEFYSSVSLAIGMGAALQYGRELWVDTDMWYFALVPGHPPEEVWCNLLLAYWLGADLVYLEGSGYNLLPAGRQGTPFALMNQIDPARYQLTPHGEMLKRFCRTYLPAHPRPWSFRDVRPDMAIIRFEDTDFGQRSWGAEGLYGTKALQPDRDTSAWLGLWNVLTHGHTGTDGLAYFKPSVRHPVASDAYHQTVTPSWNTDPASAEHRFFVPLNGAVVFDHQVEYERLQSIPLLFLTGKHVSDNTLSAIRRCVDAGAICVAWGPLVQRHGFTQWTRGVRVWRSGRGRWVLTDDFGAPAAVREYRRFLGRSDTISYRFGARRVTLTRQSDNDITVQVQSG